MYLYICIILYICRILLAPESDLAMLFASKGTEVMLFHSGLRGGIGPLVDPFKELWKSKRRSLEVTLCIV